jgi:polyhydroxyalkanoate synthase
MTTALDDWIAASHAAAGAALRERIAALPLDATQRERMAFAAEHWIAATAPCNFLATNPAALMRAVETGGRSLADGMRLLIEDVARGRVANTDEAAFEVGRDLAATPGSVVMKNELVELIQYAPATPRVAVRPLLIVPPCINKYYILDLGPDNSFVRHCVESGRTVFMVSWRNPGAAQARLGWDDYLRLGVVESLAAVRAIRRGAPIDALGFCVGGTLLASALAALAARGERPVASLTLLATMLDFSDVGPIGVYVDAATVAQREAALAAGGLIAGRELMAAFASLRPRELIWNSAAQSYLMGRAPPAFDLLYWNADSTNLPGPMYCHYLRHMYLENRLRDPGATHALGEAIDFTRLTMPTYLLATREDHIVPWRAAYATTRLTGGATRFVLGAAGHIAGIVNPARRNRRSHWVGDAARTSRDADEWLGSATEVPGSWWRDWTAWLDALDPRRVPAPRRAGGARHPPLYAAPGEYVKVRVS